MSIKRDISRYQGWRSMRHKINQALEPHGPASRLFSVLELTSEMGMISVADLVRLLNIPRPTAHRLLSQLESLGYLQRLPYKGKFGASPRLTGLANSLLSSTISHAPARAILYALSQDSGHTHHISILNRGELEYFDVLEADTVTLQLPPGKRAPLHCNASGQLFLAYCSEKILERFLLSAPWPAYTAQTITTPDRLLKRIQEIRERGYSMQDSEYVMGIAAAAVPIRNKRGRIVAALGTRVMSSGLQFVPLEPIVKTMQIYAGRLGQLF
jgi:IclR family transcriptional regulator, acetate operon repressor